nr:MAG TPA: hypothetical protein [Caudoviricetes sp.]
MTLELSKIQIQVLEVPVPVYFFSSYSHLT